MRFPQKILLTADLHLQARWYRWLMRVAPAYDAVVIAGDLLDGYKALPAQLVFLTTWMAEFRALGVPLLVADGNHDFNLGPLSRLPEFSTLGRLAESIRPLAIASHWLGALAKIGEGSSVMASGGNHWMGNILFTVCFHDPDDVYNGSLWEEGAVLRDKHPGITWIVVTHEPPTCAVGAWRWSCPLTTSRTRRLSPSMVLCGHDHLTPLRARTCSDRIGASIVLNPGHVRHRKWPCHVVIDVEAMSWEWRS